MNRFAQSLFWLRFRSKRREVIMEKLLMVDTILKSFLAVEVMGLIIIITAIVVTLQQIP